MTSFLRGALTALGALVAVAIGAGSAEAVHIYSLTWQPGSQALDGGLAPLYDTRYDGDVVIHLEADHDEESGGCAIGEVVVALVASAEVEGEYREVEFTTRPIAGSDVMCAANFGSRREIGVRWSDNDLLREWAEDIYSLTRGERPAFSIRAYLKSGGAGFDNVSFAVDTLPLIPSGDVIFGGHRLRVSTLDAATLLPSGGCASGWMMMGPLSLSYVPEASANASFGAGTDTWTATDTACVGIGAPSPSDGVDLVVQSTTAPASMTLSGTFVGLQTAVVGGFTELGFVPAFVAVVLPSGHAFHGRYTSGKLRPGYNYMYMSPVPGNTLANTFDGLAAYYSSPIEVTLSVEGLPFGFVSTEFELSSVGLRLADAPYLTYLRNHTWGEYDERRPTKKGPKSNDVRFANAYLVETAPVITERGVAATIYVPAGTGRTHYPQGTQSWQSHTLSIADGALVEGGGAPAGATLAYDTRTRCPGCTDDYGKILTRTVTSAVPETMLGDGTTAVRVTVPHEPMWGPNKGASGHVFERVGDSGNEGWLVLPGFLLKGSEASGVNAADALAGSVMRRDSGWARNVLGSPDAAAGNGFFPGLNLGPETYRRASDAQPVAGEGRLLGATSLKIAFGGANKAHTTLGSSDGTKLLETNGGVTGVFNFDAPPTPALYGYNVSIDGFAIRQSVNKLDPATGFRGAVTVGGKAGFRVAFANLGLECSGQVGSGMVDPADASNRTQRLLAWNAPFDLKTIAFKPAPGDGACSANDRVLWAGGGVKVADFGASLDLDAGWTPAGESTQASLVSPGTVEISKRKGVDKFALTPEDAAKTDANLPGFKALLSAVSLASKSCNTTSDPADACGWFEFDAKVGLPFWKALDATLRVTNLPDGANVKAGPTMVVKKGATTPSWATGTLATIANEVKETAAGELDSSYDWAFNVSLPIRWDTAAAGATNETVRFISDPKRNKEQDLAILKLRAATDYVTPTQTAVTFGASADLSKLAAPDFALSIDLKDPVSVGRVDDFLDKIIGQRPLKPIVEGIQQPSRFIKQAIGARFDEFLADEIKTFIEDKDMPIYGATETIANSLGAVQALPQRLTTQLFDLVKAGINEAFAAVGGVADGLALQLYNELPAKYAALYSALESNASTQTLEQLRGELAPLIALLTGPLKTGFDSLQTGLDKALAGAQTMKAEVTKIANTVDGIATAAFNALDSLLGQLEPNTEGTALSYFNCGTSNPILKQVDKLGGQIKIFSDTLNLSRFTSFVQPAASLVGINAKDALEGIDKMVSPVRGLTEKLVGTDGKSGLLGKVKALICDNDATNRVKSLAAKIKAFFGPIRDSLQTFRATDPSTGRTKLGQIVFSLNETVDKLIGPAHKAPITTLNGLNAALKNLKTQTDDLAKELKALVSATSLSQPGPIPPLTGISTAERIAEYQAHLNELAKTILVTLGVPESQIGAGWVDDAANPTRSFVPLVLELARKPVDEFVGTVSSEVGKELAALVAKLPFPTGADLRKMILDFIVQSPLFEQLNKLMHEATHLLFGELDKLGNGVLDQLNNLLKEITTKFNQMAAALLGGATSAVADFAGMGAGKLDGRAEIQGDELMRLKIDAEWKSNDTAKGKSEGQSSTFRAGLLVESWKVNGKAKNCPGATLAEGSTPLDASISVYNLPFVLGPGNLKISKLMLGFTLQPDPGKPVPIYPVGLFGGIDTTGKLDFQTFQLFDIALRFGAGKYETYLGARAKATFQGYALEAAFLAGKTCNGTVLTELDPEFGKYVKLPGGVFEGAYVRGSAQIPIYNIGCLFKVGAGVDVGFWILNGGYGGLIGGRIYGRALCLVGVAGGVRLIGQVVGGEPELEGEGWAAGGIGFCDSDEWRNVEDAKNDDMCAVGWAAIGAKYSGGSFSLTKMDINGLD